MKESIFIGLIQNIAVLLTFAMIYENFWLKKESSSKFVAKVITGFFVGIIGVVMQSSGFLILLGLFTFIGAFTSRSLYDYLYKYLFSSFIRLGDMPKHGIPRRIGCGIGACMYIISGIGFYWGSDLLAYIPSVFMITFALIAGIFNWCFVSTFYGLIVGKKQECCS